MYFLSSIFYTSTGLSFLGQRWTALVGSSNKGWASYDDQIHPFASRKPAYRYQQLYQKDRIRIILITDGLRGREKQM